MWRPKDWDEIVFGKCQRKGGFLNGETPIMIEDDKLLFEAGADAMLEVLRSGATKVNNVGDPPNGKGVIVFIPEDRE